MTETKVVRIKTIAAQAALKYGTTVSQGILNMESVIRANKPAPSPDAHIPVKVPVQSHLFWSAHGQNVALRHNHDAGGTPEAKWNLLDCKSYCKSVWYNVELSKEVHPR